jgi:flagellar export protein FliJ
MPQEPIPPSDNQGVTGSAFRFRLERVRAVRERKEKLAQRDLADAISRRSSSAAVVREADASLEHARDEQRTIAAGRETVSATDLLARQAFLERVEAQRRIHVSELEQREVEVAERDAELATAASEHEMLNRLRERHRGGRPRDCARREVGVLDEIAATRFRGSRA